MRPSSKWLGLAVLLAMLGGAALWALPQNDGQHREVAAERPSLGLMTSLPIYWGQAASVADMLAPPDEESPRHWIRGELERDFDLVPLDTLAGTGETAVAAELESLDLLLLAQPYTLTPAENVALDRWVRGGGRLLMFADPVLTEHSEFALGDRRRPQEIGLVPPVFARWGIAQTFDDAQSHDGGAVDWHGMAVPVNQRGIFVLAQQQPPHGGDCRRLADGLIVRCSIEQGDVLIIADAAVLEHPATPERKAALNRLVFEALVALPE